MDENYLKNNISFRVVKEREREREWEIRKSNKLVDCNQERDIGEIFLLFFIINKSG